MDNSLGKEISIWLDTTPRTNFPNLKKEESADVAIIGGGISGLTCAYLLSNAGKKVVILESGRLAESTTGHTTAKITAAHGLIYKYLLDEFGQKRAQIYAEANQSAIDFIAALVEEKQIECNFKRMPAFTYAAVGDDIKPIEEEVIAAASLGLPVHFTLETPLPFPVDGAIRYEDQAMFHPRKYLLFLAELIIKNGGKIYENTKVLDIKEEQNIIQVHTNKRSINANNAIIATNYPIYDPNLFFARLTSRQSYTLAAELNSEIPEGLFYSTEKSFHSMRPHYENGKSYLIIGGEVFKTGQESDAAKSYQKLAQWVLENFDVKCFAYRWTTSDTESPDRVPIIGQLTSKSDNIYVASSFSGWGMTHSAVAGMILSDLILGRKNPWQEFYGLQRLKNFNWAKSSPEKLPLNIPRDFFAGVKRDEGKILIFKKQAIAAYKDEKNELHVQSAVCTHMGCVVGWNKKDKTWDCPCHGSRYNMDGKVIYGPAARSLEKINLDVK